MDAEPGPIPGGTGGVVEIPCLWFFLPLPHPIGLPVGWMSTQPLTQPELLRVQGPTSGLHSSLIVHQLDPSIDQFLTNMADLALFASATMIKQPIGGGEASVERLAALGDLGSLRSVRTVAEVALPGHLAETEGQILAALDAAIDHVRLVQRVVATATQAAVSLLSRRSLPPFVPTFKGVTYMSTRDDPSPKLPEAHESLIFNIPDCAPPTALGLRPKPFDDDMLERILVASSQSSRGAPFETYADLRREAMVQRNFGGNNRMAVVAVAAAGEVLLDTMLLHMLWEEHAPPDIAASHFGRGEGHTNRVGRRFPPRLGGGWDPGSDSPGGTYLRVVVRLRHRVVHAGHEPSGSELQAAVDGLLALEHYLGDRLAAGRNLKRYTRTAVAWMADTGLRSRNRLTRHVEQLVDDRTEPNWVDTFARWQTHVDRALNPAPEDPGANTDELMLYADVLDDGTVRWMIHDYKTAHATVVDPHAVRSNDEITHIVEALKGPHGNDPADRRIAMLLDRSVPPTVTWVPDHTLIQEFELFPGTATTPPL